MKKTLLLVALMGLAGCTTTPIATEKAMDVPAERILNKELIRPGSDKGILIVKRDSGHVGNACYSRLYLDGKEVAQIGASEKVILYPAAGSHILGAEPKGMCGGSMSEATITVVPEKTLTYRVGYDSGVIFGLKPTAF